MKTLAAFLSPLLLAPSALGATAPADPFSARYQKALAQAKSVCSAFELSSALSDVVEKAGCEVSGSAVACEKPPKDPEALLKGFVLVSEHAKDAASALQSNCPWQLYAARAQAAQSAVNAAKSVDPLEKNECRNALSLVTEKRDLSGFYSAPRRAQTLAAEYSRLITQAETLCQKAVADGSDPATVALDKAKMQALATVQSSNLTPAMKLAYREAILARKSSEDVTSLMDGSEKLVSMYYKGQSPNDYYKAQLAALQPAITALGDDAFRIQIPLNALQSLVSAPLDISPFVIDNFQQTWGKLGMSMSSAQTAAKNTAALKATFTSDQNSAIATINALKWIGDPSRADFLSQVSAQSSALDCHGQCWTPWQNALAAAETQLTTIVAAAQRADNRYQSFVFNANNLIMDANTTGNPAVTAAQKASLVSQVKTFQGIIKSSTLDRLLAAYKPLLAAFNQAEVMPRDTTPEY